jgi:hypothetical protein
VSAKEWEVEEKKLCERMEQFKEINTIIADDE